MPGILTSMDTDSDQENYQSNSPTDPNMSRKTPQQRKLTYRNLLNKIEAIRKYF